MSAGGARATFALLVLGVGAITACMRPASRPPVVEAPPGAAAPATAAASPAGGAVRIVIFGDFGEPNAQQRAVAAAMAAEHAARPFDLGFSLGDNIYPCGPDPTLPGADGCRFDADGNTVALPFTPPDDPRFAERFERAIEPFAAGPRPFPVYLALGNHDVAGGGGCREGELPRAELARLRACLEVAHRGASWKMPGRHYVVDFGPARFVVIDSNLLLGDYGGFSIDAEVAFVAEAARGAGGRQLFLVAHHPAATAGIHRDDFRPAYLERLGRVVAAAGGAIVAWFAGHDHDLQHLRAPDGLDVLVSGNGSIARPFERFELTVPAGARQLFASTAWGFAVLEVGAAGWAVRFLDEKGDPQHCCEARAGGRCEPISCPRR